MIKHYSSDARSAPVCKTFGMFQTTDDLEEVTCISCQHEILHQVGVLPTPLPVIYQQVAKQIKESQ